MMNNSFNPGKPDPAMTNYGGFGGQMQPQAMPQNTGIVPPQMQGMGGGMGHGFGGGQSADRPRLRGPLRPDHPGRYRR